jgi:hypothetical protein
LSARIDWPEGKRFAFTVFDDTDLSTLENVSPVYKFLEDLGFRTTKSVWSVRGAGTPQIGGTTCEDPDYLAWTLELQASGFEIGSHGATYLTASRDLVDRSIERFREMYGHYPLAMANHAGCAESIYWGPDRVSGVNRLAYKLMTHNSRTGYFRGHKEGDPLFWGDICKAKIRYVRNFTYADINTLAACPMMPYHDPERPFVNHCAGWGLHHVHPLCERLLQRRYGQSAIQAADGAAGAKGRMVRARDDAIGSSVGGARQVGDHK